MLAISQAAPESVVAASATVRWVWLAVAFPLAGFLINGALALWKPSAKKVVSIVGAGTLLAAIVGAVVLAKRRL